MKMKLLILAGLLATAHLATGQNYIADEYPTELNADNVLGFGFLSKIAGLWHGPVTTATKAGNFDNWYVDFRPVSAGQVSQYSLLDSNTINNMSFFIVRHNGQLKVAQRTDACLKDKCCVTYEVMDSVSEDQGYYRFSDCVIGDKRASTVYQISDNSFEMKVFTNKFNTLNKLELHATWTAELGSKAFISDASEHFNFPQPEMIKDFSDAFKGMQESIFFTFENDPYKSEDQPYVGSVYVDISINTELKVDKNDEICLLITTEPLFKGIKYIEDNLRYLSKYVYLTSETTHYEIRNMHPGKYYIYSFLDKNKDKKHEKGDYMSSNPLNSFVVSEKQKTIANTLIDYIIP